MTFVLARSLLQAGAVTPTAVAEALFFAVTRRTSLVRALLTARAIDPLRLEQALEQGQVPYLHHIVPIAELAERLPRGLCERLLAVPVRTDPRTAFDASVVDVAVVDAFDPHPADEMAYWLQAPVRVVRTSIVTMEAALLRLVRPGTREPEPIPAMKALAPPIWTSGPTAGRANRSQTPMYGIPAFDLPATAPKPPADEPDIAIPLTRRNPRAEPVFNLGPPAVEKPMSSGRNRQTDTDPILDLRRRKPGSVERSTGLTLGAFAERMNASQDRDAIFDLLVAGMRSVARRAAVLAVRRDALVGWTGSREVTDLQALRAVRLPNAVRTVFHDVLDSDEARIARIPLDAAHVPLIAIMRSPPSGEVVIAAVRALGKPVAVVFADGIVDGAAAVDQITALVQSAGKALGRLLHAKASQTP